MGSEHRSAQPLEYISPETRALIERMCSYLDDNSIARFVGCSKGIVKHIRSRIPKPRGRPPRQAHMVATKSQIHDSSIVKADKQRDAETAAACEALLRRQLETGQHSLTADQFYAICQAKGWLEPARKSGG